MVLSLPLHLEVHVEEQIEEISQKSVANEGRKSQISHLCTTYLETMAASLAILCSEDGVVEGTAVQVPSWLTSMEEIVLLLQAVLGSTHQLGKVVDSSPTTSSEILQVGYQRLQEA